MTDIETVVEQAAAGLAVGEGRRIVCPYCNGGSERERSFGLTRTSAKEIVFQCFRASCPGDVHGRIRSVVGESERREPASRPKDEKAYRGLYVPLYEEDLDYFVNRFEIENAGAYIGHDSEGRYVLPIFGPLGEWRGYVVRHKAWKPAGEFNFTPPGRMYIAVRRDGPKVIAYPNDLTAPMQSIYRGASRMPFVVVEDQLSAMKVRQHVGATGVALLGVGMDLQKARELQKMKPTEVVFALDADASKDAFRIAQQWGLAFKSTRVVLLDKDLKDTPATELREVLGIYE